jgi:hypothetical protein
MDKKRYTVELSEKEMYLLWCVLAWFSRNPFTSVLRRKFEKVPYYRRKELAAKYDRAIDDQLIAQGQWLADYRARQEAKHGE